MLVLFKRADFDFLRHAEVAAKLQSLPTPNPSDRFTFFRDSRSWFALKDSSPRFTRRVKCVVIAKRQPALNPLHPISFSPHPIFTSHCTPVVSHRSPISVFASHQSRATSHILPGIRNFRAFMRLPALELSCGFFRLSRRLFSITCALFDKNTGVAYPLPICASHSEVPSRAQKAQKRPPVSPVFATLTNSPSRNPFPCHSYENTRDGSAAESFLSGVYSLCSLCLCGEPSSLTTFRINTCISVASKRLYLPSESTLTKKQGEGGGVPTLDLFPRSAHSVNSAASHASAGLSHSETNNLQLATVNSQQPQSSPRPSETNNLQLRTVNSQQTQSSPRLFPSKTNNLQLRTVNSQRSHSAPRFFPSETNNLQLRTVNSQRSHSAPRLFPSETNNLQLRTVNSQFLDA